MTTALDPTTELPLPASDASIFGPDLGLARLMHYWDAQSRLRPMTAEQMRGADVRAQRLGIPGEELMEHAGVAVAAAARALMLSADRSLDSLVLILCGPGNNGGDGLVAARRLAQVGIRSEVVLVSSETAPSTRDALLNWERLEGLDLVERVHGPRAHDVAIFLNGIERAGLVVDALLGTGVRGALREPVRTAVDVAVRARELLVPVLAVDTPTSLDLSTGVPSDPNVHADATITFHRPKAGLSSRAGQALAGRVLVAPIGIPLEADPRVNESAPAPRDRKIILLLAVLVVAILGVGVASALVPGMDGAFASIPIVVLVLVIGTITVLGRSIRRS